MERSKCPECKSDIGGLNHSLTAGNSLASDMDGASYAAWSDTANNIANFNLNIWKKSLKIYPLFYYNFRHLLMIINERTLLYSYFSIYCRNCCLEYEKNFRILFNIQCCTLYCFNKEDCFKIIEFIT